MCELHRGSAQVVEVANRGVADFIEELVVGITNGRVYGLDHPRVKASATSLRFVLERILADRGSDELVIGSAEGFLFLDGEPLIGVSLAAPRIIEPLTTLHAGGIAFRSGAGESDFLPFLEMFRKKRREETDVNTVNLLLKRKGCDKISLLPPYQKDGRYAAALGVHTPGLARLAASPDPGAFSIDIPVRLYQSVVDHLQDLMIDVYRGEEIALDETRGYVESILGRLTSSPPSMMSIARYEQYDAYTFGHSIRVCCLALNFAGALSLDPEILLRIGVAALVHDIGKAWVPFDILHSTARLTEDERVEMNKHTLYGAEILIEMGDADPMAVSAAYGHHLAQGGRGYPRTLREIDVSTATKIVKLCDVYEALTAVRPYKDRMTPSRAYRVMMSMQSHFDPALLCKFVHVNGLYPTGSRVRLSTGETGRVHGQGRRFEAPVVEIETAPEGGLLHESERRRIDLSTLPPEVSTRIEEMLVDSEIA